MKFWLFVSIIPLSLAWPAPYNQSSIVARDTSDLSRRAAAPVFYPWQGKKRGGCKKHLDAINEAYDQALEMAIQAKDALAMLKSGRPKSSNPATKDEFNNGLKWDKYQRSFKDLFNIEVDAQKQLDGAAEGEINRLRGNFNAIASLKGAAPNPKDSKKPRLFCGEKGIETRNPGEKMRDSDTTVAGQYGAWVFPKHDAPLTADGNKDDTKQIPRKMVDKLQGAENFDHPCKEGGGKALAVTIENGNAIFICDGGLTKAATLTTPVEGQKMKSTLVKDRALSDTLLHEMFHLFQKLKDVPKVKFANREDDEPVWKNKDQRTPEREDDLAYGYWASYELAQYVPAAAKKNVEYHVRFAISVFNEDWKFEGKDGVAKKMELKK